MTHQCRNGYTTISNINNTLIANTEEDFAVSRYAMCPECGHRLRRALDFWGSWDGESYECDHCPSEFEYDEEDGEYLSVDDAALIWASNGRDEDYMFGYSEDELEDAL